MDFFAGQCSSDLPLALISQFVCHNCSVPGFTDGAGFRFGVDASAVEISQTVFLR